MIERTKRAACRLVKLVLRYEKKTLNDLLLVWKIVFKYDFQTLILRIS
jgi:hypothetical protein